MASRSDVNNAQDRMIFRHTATTTKKINVAPKIMRGDTRL